MTFELWTLAAAIVLGFLHILLQAHSSNIERGFQWNVGARDDVLPPLTGQAGRLERALRNFGETFPLFAASVLLAVAIGANNLLTELGAGFYIGGRVVYLPLYAYGVRYLRSAAWNIATLGIILVLAGVVTAGADPV
jgi:uncharacterized MAPEG superfamily protein